MKKLLFLLLVLGAGLAGVAYWVSYDRRHGHDADVYTVVPAEFGKVSEVVSATGIVQARDVFPVGTELSGKIVEVLADFNQTVHEGDLLLRLDDRMARDRVRQAGVAVDLARVSVKQAEATRDTAARALDRVRQQSPEVRRQTDLDVAESQLRAAEVGVEAAKVRVREAEEAGRQADLGLRLTEVRAPALASGGAAASPGEAVRTGVGTLAREGGAAGKEKRAFTVLDRKVSLNQVVGPPASAHLFTLAGGMERMQVLVQVAEGDVNKVRRGMPARFTVSGSDGDVAFHGTVEEVRLVPASEHGAVFYRVVVEARNERGAGGGDWQLRPGLTASVDFVRRVHDRVWKLPSAALNVQPEPATLTPAARARLDRLQSLREPAAWKVAWVVGPENRPWPLFVRVGGTDTRGETGVQDAQVSEVLEWDPELSPRPDPGDPATFPKVIIGLPPAKKGGLFNPPNIKL